MLEAEIKTSVLSNIIRPVTTLVDEATIKFSNGGMRIKTVDSASVGAISLSLLSDGFDNYAADGTEVRVNLTRIESITRKTNNEETIEIHLNEDNHNLRLSTSKYKFDLSLYEDSSVRNTQEALEIDPPGKIVIDSDEVREAISIASMFSDELTMGIDQNEDIFYMRSRGDNDEMRVTFANDDVIDLSAANARSTFSLRYLEKMSKVIPPGTEVHIQIGKEYPAKIYYEIASGDGRITYGLAPRVG